MKLAHWKQARQRQRVLDLKLHMKLAHRKQARQRQRVLDLKLHMKLAHRKQARQRQRLKDLKLHMKLAQETGQTAQGQTAADVDRGLDGCVNNLMHE